MIPTLTPAYGRDYRNEVKVLADFYEGKDFVLNGPHPQAPYCSVRDFPNGTEVAFRYGKLTKKFIHKVKK